VYIIYIYIHTHNTTIFSPFETAVGVTEILFARSRGKASMRGRPMKAGVEWKRKKRERQGDMKNLENGTWALELRTINGGLGNTQSFHLPPD